MSNRLGDQAECKLSGTHFTTLQLSMLMLERSARLEVQDSISCQLRAQPLSAVDTTPVSQFKHSNSLLSMAQQQHMVVLSGHSERESNLRQHKEIQGAQMTHLRCVFSKGEGRNGLLTRSSWPADPTNPTQLEVSILQFLQASTSQWLLVHFHSCPRRIC